MTREEFNTICELIEEFSTEYDCFSIGDSEAEFNSCGCLVCNSLPCDTYDMTFLAKSDIRKGIFCEIMEGSICGDCLCALVNSDMSGHEFSVVD